MDPITLILAALAAGAVSGAKDVASEAVSDAYGALKSLVRRKLQGNPAQEMALEQHAEDPDTWNAPLKKALTDSGADQDEAILAQAKALLEQIPPGSEAQKYVTNVYGGKVTGWIQGDHAVLTINTGEPGTDG
jgi:hypothetical protein